MRTEIYVENNKLDLNSEIDTEFSYAIDDIKDFASRNTSFSKTINIAGTPNNNAIFGNAFSLPLSNPYDPNLPRVYTNFNASVSAQCRIFIDNIQIFKGIIRILQITQQERKINYECSVFGDLGGFITALGNKKLTGNDQQADDLDFSAYDRAWNYTNIINSWDTIAGSGVYFPLIDYGDVSVNKIDFQYKAFRPAFYVKEILEKILAASGYTWDFQFLSSALMQRLVIPNNQRIVSKVSNTIFDADFSTSLTSAQNLPITVLTAGSFTGSNPITFTGTNGTVVNIKCRPVLQIKSPIPVTATITLYKGATILKEEQRYVTNNTQTYNLNLDVNGVTLDATNQLSVQMSTNITQYQLFSGDFQVINTVATEVAIGYDEVLVMNQLIPKGIFQRDFFISICKMFNLYVTDDPIDEKKLIIKPFNQFYTGETIDWSDKVDRSNWTIKPMSEINARYFQFKYKPDNDYYAENYRKKFNEGYGDFIYDTQFDFVKETDSTEIIFASSVLIQKDGTDKAFPAIYKLSSNNTTEDPMDCVIRIMQAKKITGRTTYAIKNGSTTLTSQTAYGYAGHLDSPYSPTEDINWGAPAEIYFPATTYPTTNLFNANYSDYMSEITDKDSKLLTCQVLIDSLDIQNLDFSKYIYIDNVLFRLNRIEDYNPVQYKLTKVELLKVIDKID